MSSTSPVTRSLVDLTVHCWGADRPGATRRRGAPAVGAARGTRAPAISVDLTMAAGVEGANLVHSHTWYANLAGHFAKLTYDVPHVVTVHSLEPMRPGSRAARRRLRPLELLRNRPLEHADAIVRRLGRAHAAICSRATRMSRPSG